MVSFDHWYRALAHAGPAYDSLLRTALGTSHVRQQGFSTLDDILVLAQRAGADTNTCVLDVCCGAGGPGAALAGHLRCRVVGLDLSLTAIGHGLRRYGDRVTFLAGDATRLPFRSGSLDVVLLLDSLASFVSASGLLAELSRVLKPGGRLAFTADVGEPFQQAEGMDDEFENALVSEADLLTGVLSAGLRLVWLDDQTSRRAEVAQRLADGLNRQRRALARELGRRAVADVSACLATWAQLLAGGRVRELALVVQQPYASLALAPRDGEDGRASEI